MIINSVNGISNFVPVIFDYNFYSLLNVVIHSSLIDFRYRPLPDIMFSVSK